MTVTAVTIVMIVVDNNGSNYFDRNQNYYTDGEVINKMKFQIRYNILFLICRAEIRTPNPRMRLSLTFHFYCYFSGSWSKEVALRIDKYILEQVEALEDKVQAASMQVPVSQRGICDHIHSTSFSS